MVHKRVPSSNTGSNQKVPQSPSLRHHNSELAMISVFFHPTHGAENYTLQPIIEAASAANGTGEGDGKVYKRHLLSLYGLFQSKKTVYQY